jgi:hypothetical protein
LLGIINSIKNYSKNIEVITKKLNPDIIQVFSHLLLPTATKLKKLLKCKLVYDCYEPWIHSSLADKKYHSAILYYVIHKKFLKNLDGAIFVYRGNPLINYLAEGCKKICITNVLKQSYIPNSQTASTKRVNYAQQGKMPMP